MTMLVRSYAPSDESAVIALWQACGLTRPWNDPRKDIARKMAVQPELFLVGTEDGRIIASVMAGYDGHRGSVNYLAVSPTHQGRGFGKQLMRHVEEVLTALGCPKINLMVRGTNQEVIAFYDRLEFARDDVVSLGKRLIPDLPSAPVDAT
jgi:ribosomal protein S18 acetylase RimI-like enzyme